MMKAMTRAEVMTETARQAGRDPATFTFGIIVRTATGQEQREVSIADLWAEAAPLAGYGLAAQAVRPISGATRSPAASVR